MGKRQKKKGNVKDRENPGGCVIPDFLYIGPVSVASDLNFLTSHQINTVLSIGKTPRNKRETISTANGPKQITYHRLNLEDKENADIRACVEKARAILDQALESKARVLVHCSAAISRSPTIVIAYLMSRYNLSLRQSLDKVVATRSVAAPNPGFLAQLERMEEELFPGLNKAPLPEDGTWEDIPT